MPNESDPLSDLYADDRPYDEQRLVSVLGDFIQIDSETGQPIPQPAFGDLTPMDQAVAMMVYRRAAAELGELDEDVPAGAPWFDEYSAIEEAAVVDITRDYPFVEDDDGKYHVPEHAINGALDYFVGKS